MEKVPVLLFCILQFLYWCRAGPTESVSFYYQHIRNSSANTHLLSSVVKLRLQTQSRPVLTTSGSNATLPCLFWHEGSSTGPRVLWLKWSWVPAAGGRELPVLVMSGPHQRSFGRFKGRVYLRQDHPGDASLIISGVVVDDGGRYRCEVIDGLEDESVAVDLSLRGVVFPYQPLHGRYMLTFSAAQKACQDQGAIIATPDQLQAAWLDGLHWCNAGWLADGSVRYPITIPREQCGGTGVAAGVRNYGRRPRHWHRFDVFCFAPDHQGQVYFLPTLLNFTRAGNACEEHGAQMANVGQIFAAWRFQGLDRCDAGWLTDGSLRYPISQPRPNCGPQEPGIRSFGFPPSHRQHGVYCYKSM